MPKLDAQAFLGKLVSVIVDRPLGAKHPRYEDMLYPVNYGYLPHTQTGDGMAQDVYILGVNEALTRFEGVCIAVIERLNDVEDKFIVVPKTYDYRSMTDKDILNAVHFTEQYFDVRLLRY